MKQAKKNRVVVLAGLFAVWGVVLWQQFSAPAADTDATAVPPGADLGAAAPTPGSAATREPAAALAPPPIVYMQERVAKLPFERNPFRRPGTAATQSPGSTPVAPAPVFHELRFTSVIGNEAVINGRRVRVGALVPGTRATLRTIGLGFVEVELDGELRTIAMAPRSRE